MTVYTTQGTKFYRGDAASPEVFTQITQLSGIGPIGQDRGLIDVTNLGSSAREYKKAIKDGMEMSLRFQYDPANTGHDNLRADRDSEVAHNYKVTLPTGSPEESITFAAQCTGWQIDDLPIDGVITLTVTLKPTGDLTFA